jgi:ribosome-dependent ATPase
MRFIDQSDKCATAHAFGRGLAIEIPPGFGRDAECGRPVQISAWIDGAMPTRGEMIRAYGGDASAVAFAEKGSFA